MREYIKIKCNSCQLFGERKGAQLTVRCDHVLTAAGFSFERIAMDIVEPLAKTPHNNRYILVVIDYYNRWP